MGVSPSGTSDGMLANMPQHLREHEFPAFSGMVVLVAVRNPHTPLFYYVASSDPSQHIAITQQGYN